jgi:hypothetical protein
MFMGQKSLGDKTFRGTKHPETERAFMVSLMSILRMFICILRKKSVECGGKIYPTNDFATPACGKIRGNCTPQSTEFRDTAVV